MGEMEFYNIFLARQRQDKQNFVIDIFLQYLEDGRPQNNYFL
jgi:hypothetical protein